jgi:hypothetical protein
MDRRFEAVVIPVADVGRSEEFYTKLEWRLDADFPFDNSFWFFSSCSRCRVLGSVWPEDDIRCARDRPKAST